MTRMEAYRYREDLEVEKKGEKAKVLELKRKGEGVCRGCKEKIDAGWTYCPFCFTVVENPILMRPNTKKAEVDNYKYLTRECPECKERINRHFIYCPTCWALVE